MPLKACNPNCATSQWQWIARLPQWRQGYQVPLFGRHMRPRAKAGSCSCTSAKSGKRCCRTGVCPPSEAADSWVHVRRVSIAGHQTATATARLQRAAAAAPAMPAGRRSPTKTLRTMSGAARHHPPCLAQPALPAVNFCCPADAPCLGPTVSATPSHALLRYQWEYRAMHACDVLAALNTPRSTLIRMATALRMAGGGALRN